MPENDDQHHYADCDQPAEAPGPTTHSVIACVVSVSKVPTSRQSEVGGSSFLNRRTRNVQDSFESSRSPFDRTVLLYALGYEARVNRFLTTEQTREEPTGGGGLFVARALLSARDVLHDLVNMLAAARPCSFATHSARNRSAHLVFPLDADAFPNKIYPPGVY